MTRTREAVSKVFNVPLVYHEELWQQIQDWFGRYNRTPTENNIAPSIYPREQYCHKERRWHRAGLCL
jgi:molybdopterin-biosynthesis enzyme MoeA-like protein